MDGSAWLGFLGALSVAVLMPAQAAGETGSEAPVAVEEVAQLVADLNHEDFARRETATRRLAELGGAGLPLVLEAALGSDPEAASRGTRVLVFYADSFDESVVRPVVNELEQRTTSSPGPGTRRAASLLDLMVGRGARDRSKAHLARFGPLLNQNDDRVHTFTLGLDWSGTERDLRHLIRFSELASLDISKTAMGDAALEILPRLPNLEKLFIGKTAISEAGLAALRGAGQLKYLSLEGLGIGDAGAAHVAPLTSLEHLGFDYTAVTDAALQHVVNMKELQTLWLNGVAIDGPGLRHLEGLPKLKKLVLAKAPFTDKGMPYLRGLKQLEQLGLDDTRITDAGIEHLEALANLKRLWLNRTEITDKSIASLAKLKQLKTLSIPGCKFSEEGISKLRELLPGCEIGTE